MHLVLATSSGALANLHTALPAPISTMAVLLVEPADAATRDPLSPDVLASHGAFFDHLVELVPPRHYHDLDADRVSMKYMKKADREAAKAAFRKQHKQVRACRLAAAPSAGPACLPAYDLNLSLQGKGEVKNCSCASQLVNSHKVF